MKVITLWQPWASFIALGWKTTETRTHDRFKNLVGETIGIHAGNVWDKDWRELASEYMDSNQIHYTENEINFGFLIGTSRGKILCTVKVDSTRELFRADSAFALIDCKYTTRYGLFLTDIKQIQPVPAKGKQGIWNYDFKPGELVYL